METSRHARRVALYGLKGSSGKTTLVTTCAAAAARAGADVLILDADPHADAVRIATGWHRVTVQPWTRGARVPGARLVLIDCPPDARQAAGALADADLIIIPVEPEPLAVVRLAEVLGTLPAGVPYAVVVNSYYSTPLTDQVLADLTTTLGDHLWLPTIPRRAAFPNSQSLRVPPQEYPRRPVDVVEVPASLTARMLAQTLPG